MKIEGKLLEKLNAVGIEIDEAERESFTEEGETCITKYDVAKFPVARDFIPIAFDDRIELEILLKSDFEHFKFLENYEAIWSPKFNVIECELTHVHRFAGPRGYLIRKLARIFDADLTEEDENPRFDFEQSDAGIKVSIGTPSTEYAILFVLKERIRRIEFAKRKITIRIENISISKHDQARKILEKIGNSILFKLDISTNIGLKLSEDVKIRRKIFIRNRILFEVDKSLPNYEYDKEPISLYWYAKSAREMPLLQFLAYYQILEFYFPIFSQNEAHQQIKNLIKDPRFNPNKDSDITKILSTVTTNKHQIGFGSELEQLKATIKNCVTNSDLKEMIEIDDNFVDFLKSKNSKKISSKKINIMNPNCDFISDCSERIYDIRCRVVHTKSSEKNYDLLLPSSPEIKFLHFDISILEMIVIKVLVCTSRSLKI